MEQLSLLFGWRPWSGVSERTESSQVATAGPSGTSNSSCELAPKTLAIKVRRAHPSKTAKGGATQG
jgi:hypothetical protein